MKQTKQNPKLDDPMIYFLDYIMTEENLIPPSEEPVRIRWLNAAGISLSLLCNLTKDFILEQNAALQRPIAQTPTVKTNKVTAPSVISKPRTKVDLNFDEVSKASIEFHHRLQVRPISFDLSINLLQPHR